MNIQYLSYLCYLCIVVFGFVLQGCALFQSDKAVDPIEDVGRLTKLSQQNRVLKQKEEENRLSSILLSEKSKQKIRVELTFPMPEVLTEETLYSQIVGAFQARNFDALQYYTRQLNLNFSDSVYGDNALFLLGQLSLSLGLPNEALKNFENLLQNYPLSNKRASALLNKGVALRKMQLFKYAQQAFTDVKKQFPRSPESYRVDMEEKLLVIEKGS